MSTYQVFGREFDSLDEAIEYAKAVDAYEVMVRYNGKVVSTHEL